MIVYRKHLGKVFISNEEQNGFERASEEEIKKFKRNRRNQDRRERDQVYRDMGMTKVRGALGGTYYE